MGDHLRAVSGYAQRAPVHAGLNSMYEHVLLPTDGSEPAAAAAWHALGIAGKYDATLHAIFAIDTGTSWLTVSKDEVHDALRELGQETSEDVLRDSKPRPSRPTSSWLPTCSKVPPTSGSSSTPASSGSTSS